jgi:hypothetical protein
MIGKGKVKNDCKISARVIKADGTVIDYGVIAGSKFQVWWSKLKRKVNGLWQQ